MNTKNDKIDTWESGYLSAVTLSLGVRLWWVRPDGFFSGVDEEFFDWPLVDLGLSESATGNLIASGATGCDFAPAGFGERFCLWFSFRGVIRCCDL